MCADDRGFIWTGHSDGSLHLHMGSSWDVTVLVSVTRKALLALAVDDRGAVWAGDEGGQLRQIKRDPITHTLLQVRLWGLGFGVYVWLLGV